MALRNLVTGIPSPTTEEPFARWNRRGPSSATSTSTNTPLQPTMEAGNRQQQTSTSTSTGAVATVASGSVRDRARAYEQRYAGAGQPRLAVANNQRTAKSSNESASAQIPAQVVPQSILSAGSGEDKENAGRDPLDKALSTKAPSPPNIYDLPKSRPVSYVQPVATPLTPRSLKPASTALIAPASPSMAARSSTIQAGAFRANRERANSTPKPSEWVSPKISLVEEVKAPIAVAHKTRSSVQDGLPAQREAQIAHRFEDQAVAAPAPIAKVELSRFVEHVQAPISMAQEQVMGPQLMQSPARPPISRSTTEKPARPTSKIAPARPMQSERIARPSTSTSNQIGPARPASAVVQSAMMERAFSAPNAEQQPASSTRRPSRPRSATLTATSVEAAFEEMINERNLPSDIARKMLGLDLNVKTEMLKPSGNASISTYAKSVQKRLPIPDFGKQSTSTLKESKKRPTVVRKMKSFMSAKEPTELPDGFLLVHGPSKPNSPTLGSSSTAADQKKADVAVLQSAAAQAHMLKAKTLKTLDPVKDLKKLRVLLRNESVQWLQEWIRLDGYRGLMERLWEVVTLEWREEQHDDAVLLELLRCFRALLMTDIGRSCLASYSPSPFRPLVELLFSEKKPGDLATRQCIVELLHGLFAVFPQGCAALAKEDWKQPWSMREDFGRSAARSGSMDRPRPESRVSSHLRDGSAKGSEGSSTWESAGFDTEFSFISGSTKISCTAKSTSRSSAHGLVKSLLLGPPNEKEEAKHDFIRLSHGKRPYKLWMEEIIGVLSDYFWIFCHAGNTYWRLQNIEQDKVEEPKVPGGMTGGVEFEAMEYCASQLRLLNQLLRTCASHDDAQKLHDQLFASGLEKVILTLRKCSTTYYPQIHLELARYIDLSLSCGYPLHPAIRKHIEPVSELSKSLSAGALARLQAEQQTQQQREQRDTSQGKKGHTRSRTEGQPIHRAA